MSLHDLTIEDPEALVRYLLARADHARDVWVGGRTCAAGTVVVQLRVATQIVVSCRGRMPDAGELYRVEQALHHLGYRCTPEPDVDAGVVRLRVERSTSAGEAAR